MIRTKLSNCIKLNHIYHETYYTVREQPFLPNQTPFGFSENFVFGEIITFSINHFYNLSNSNCQENLIHFASGFRKSLACSI